MTNAKLIGILEQLPEDAEVRLMTQSGHPLQAHVHGVWARQPEDIVEDEDGDEYDGIVYIVEGEQVRETPYGTRSAWELAVTG